MWVQKGAACVNLKVEPVVVRQWRPVGESTMKAVVEGTLNIPAGLPDVGRVIRMTATPRLGSTEVAADQVSLDGTLDITLVYAAVEPAWEEAAGQGEDDEAPYGEPAYGARESLHRVLWRREMAFHGVVDLAGAQQGMEVLADVRVDELRAAIARAGRALEVDAVLEAAVRCFQPDTVRIPQASGDGQLELHRESLDVLTTELRTREEASVQGRLRLPEEAAAMERPLDVDVVCAVERVALEDDRAQVEGVLDVHLAYVPAGGSELPVEFHAWQGAIRFTHRLQHQALGEGQEGQVSARVLSVDVEPEGDGRGLEVFADVELTLEVGGVRHLQVITAVGSADPEVAVESRLEPLSVETLVGVGEQVVDVSGMVELGEHHPAIERLLAHEARAAVDEVLVLGERVSVAGHMDVSLLYVARDGEVENQVHFVEWKGVIPVEAQVPVSGAYPPMRARAEMELLDIEPDLLNRETVEWRGRVRVTVTVEQTQQLEAVVEAVVVPPLATDPPTYTFVVVQPGDSLWKLSRRYRSSEEAIVAANPHLQSGEDPLAVGSKLCIPRHQPQAPVALDQGEHRNGSAP